MSAPRSLLQAALNRLAARVGSGLADTAATLSLLAQDAPSRLQQEVSLFWEEVEQEAARLERAEAQAGDPTAADAAVARGGWSGTAAQRPSSGPGAADPQELIDDLRARVARLSVRLDGPAGGSPPGGAPTSPPPAGAPGARPA